ncbi:MAG: hypothetical protein H7126_18375 [Candidatus Parcubacteria bacterium]|uniref:hypothetical protein n=1 Tax=Phormidesmis priestleyi TaxID=268141 RepID=UPI0009ED3B7F|nr:hypothetical protein [Phormidesmis priestleyi]MBC7825791.1 hypothetical protein [Leptolyngbyaceae cyanobacterium LF-bin-113]
MMTITLKLKPEIEQQLLEQAAAKGLAIEPFLEQWIETQLVQSQPSSKITSDDEHDSTQDAFINSPSFVDKPLLAEEETSREILYTKEDEQL